MSNEELKAALFSGCPVKSDGIMYKCVTAIIYRKINGKVIIQVELSDKCGNSVTIAEPRRIEEVIL